MLTSLEKITKLAVYSHMCAVYATLTPRFTSSGIISSRCLLAHSSHVSLFVSRSSSHRDTKFCANACLPAHVHVTSRHSSSSFQTLDGSFLSGHKSNGKEISKRRGRDGEETGGEEIRSADRCSTRRFFAPRRRRRAMDVSLLLLLLHHFCFPPLSVPLLPFLFSLVKPEINRINLVPLILRQRHF